MTLSSSSLIAERYARALFALGGDARALDALAEDLRALSALSKESAEFGHFLHNPLLPRAAKAKAMDSLLEKMRANALTRKFVRGAALNNRLSLLPEIYQSFIVELRRNRGEEEAQVVSASPLTKDQERLVQEALAKATGKRIALKAEVDPDLLGGMKIEIGGTLLDASLSGKLARLSILLKQAA